MKADVSYERGGRTLVDSAKKSSKRGILGAVDDADDKPVRKEFVDTVSKFTLSYNLVKGGGLHSRTPRAAETSGLVL